MNIRLNLTRLAMIPLLMAGCGGVEPPESAEVILPEDQTVTRPEVEIEGFENVPPLPASAAASTSAPAPAATDAAAADPGTTPGQPATTATPQQPVATTTGTEFARFTGRVTVDGNFAGLPPLKRENDPSVKADDQVCVQSAIPDDSVRVTDGRLADVFVYAKRVPAGVDVPAPPAEPAVLDQKGCRFFPQAMVLRVDQPLQMLNSDPVAHNVHITSLGGFTFNQIVKPNDSEGLTATYERPERFPVEAKCDVHTWMSSWQLPVDHPWAAVSGEDGTFVIDDLPAGDWEFIIWHNKTGYINRSYTFSAAEGQVIQQDFTVPAAELSE